MIPADQTFSKSRDFEPSVANALMLGSGNGSESRPSLGVNIVGGLICSQLLIFFTTHFDSDRRRSLICHSSGDSEAKSGGAAK